MSAISVHIALADSNSYPHPRITILITFHHYMIYALIEIPQAAVAVAGIRPRRQQWGTVSCQSFLRILDDVTSWALTHFEPVPAAWSAAEADGLKLVGRHQRLTAGCSAKK
jgi:hypothetical protein